MSIIEQVDRPLSDEDTRAIRGSDCKIMKYFGLADCNDLDDLLPKLKDYAIIVSMRKRETLVIGPDC